MVTAVPLGWWDEWKSRSVWSLIAHGDVKSSCRSWEMRTKKVRSILRGSKIDFNWPNTETGVCTNFGEDTSSPPDPPQWDARTLPAFSSGSKQPKPPPSILCVGTKTPIQEIEVTWLDCLSELHPANNLKKTFNRDIRRRPIGDS